MSTPRVRHLLFYLHLHMKTKVAQHEHSDIPGSQLLSDFKSFFIFISNERTFDKEKLILNHFIVHKLLFYFLSG